MEDVEEQSQTANKQQTVSTTRAKPRLTLRGGVIGYFKEGEPFEPRPNFDVEICGAMKLEGTILGYLFRIQRSDEPTKR